jgi:hypothetical protein
MNRGGEARTLTLPCEWEPKARAACRHGLSRTSGGRMAWMGCRTLLADAGCADAFRVRRNAGTTIARASLAREAGADPQAADFHAKRHFARQGAALSLSRESGSEDSLAGVPTGLPNTRAVVARNESGPRY